MNTFVQPCLKPNKTVCWQKSKLMGSAKNECCMAEFWVGCVPQWFLPIIFLFRIEIVFTVGEQRYPSRLFFCGSVRQLVSCVYLLPFQLDRDNREAHLDGGLCHLKATAATTEVMLWKGNGALLFSPEHSKTQMITLTDLFKRPWLVRIKGSLETTWNFSWQSSWPVWK